MNSAADDREMRNLARQIFSQALTASSVEKAFDHYVECDHGVLRIGHDLYHLNSYSRVFVTAIGKRPTAWRKPCSGERATVWKGSWPVPSSQHLNCAASAILAEGYPMPNAESVRGAEAMLKLEWFG